MTVFCLPIVGATVERWLDLPVDYFVEREGRLKRGASKELEAVSNTRLGCGSCGGGFALSRNLSQAFELIPPKPSKP